MPNSVTKRSSRIAILAVVSVIASLFAFAVPASAAAHVADFPATFTACPAGVIPDGGFTDTAGSFADANIDCIKYYGVTTGTTATTYSPAQVVTRAQMALFLTRAAGPSGITVPAAANQGFTDIAGLPQTYQDAINQIKQLGITAGTSATTYSPNDPVSRYQMALFLARWADAAVKGPGGTQPKGVTNANSPFTDLGSVSFEAYTAIRNLFEMGVTTGTSATAFSPFQAVTREQMAAFITRTMAHTNTRPAGVNIQAVPSTIFDGDDVDVAITVRTSAFLPVANALVDVFQAPLEDKADAVAANGTCVGAVVSPTFGVTECAIDVADVDTDANGNITTTVSPSDSVIWWAWSGAVGATFDADTTQVSAAEVVVNDSAAEWLITDNVADGAGYVKFGSTVTYTAQLVDADGDPVALAGETIRINNGREVDGLFIEETSSLLTSDATGKVTWTVSESDPNAGTWVAASATDNEACTYWYENGADVYDDDTTFGEGFCTDWDDDPSEAWDISLSTNVDYTTGTVINATAKVIDQYGAGLAGQEVDFYADGGFLATRTTLSSGNASQGITGAAGADGEDVEIEADNVDTGNVFKTVYFTLEAPDNTAAGPWAMVAIDAANDSLVVTDGAAAFWLLVYDANDQFRINGSPTTLAGFEAELAKTPATVTDVTFTYRTLDTNVSAFDLS